MKEKHEESKISSSKTTKNNIKNGSSVGGMLCVGCMFLGAGVGKVYGDIATGGLLGMGIGFVIMGITWAYYSKK